MIRSCETWPFTNPRLARTIGGVKKLSGFSATACSIAGLNGASSRISSATSGGMAARMSAFVLSSAFSTEDCNTSPA